MTWDPQYRDGGYRLPRKFKKRVNMHNQRALAAYARYRISNETRGLWNKATNTPAVLNAINVQEAMDKLWLRPLHGYYP